jgi:hypothetical protein
MSDLPTHSFSIGDSGVDCTLADRALIRACYRYYSVEHRQVARWMATELAHQIQQIRIGNLDALRYRKEAQHG